jgi:signal transduction histidine kinase
MKKLRLSLRNKIQFYLISLSTLIYVVAIGYIGISAKKEAYQESTALVQAQTEKHALSVQCLMNEYMTVIRTLSQSFSTYSQLPRETWDSLFNQMYDQVYRSNPDFYNLWDSWELSRIDPEWTKPYGRVSNEHFKSNGIFKSNQDLRSLDGDSELYAFLKRSKNEVVLPIYEDLYSENKGVKKIMTSLTSPILDEQGYVGLVAVDITLEKFQEMVERISINKFEGSYAFLITQEGKYAGHPNNQKLNTKAEFFTKDSLKLDLEKKWNRNETFTIEAYDENDNPHYVAFAPIKMGRSDETWYLGIDVPLNSIMAQADRNFMISIVVGLIGIILLSFVIYIVTLNITRPIERITSSLKKLSKGHINKNMKFHASSGDEIEEMSNALNASIEGLEEKTTFANEIGQGNLDYAFSLRSDDDLLGHSLIDMQKSLQQARKEEDIRKEEDRKRQWVNEGLAKFADILRQNNDNIQQLGDDIISNLVKYLDANQGGLFLLTEEEGVEPVLDLLSAFAFDRKKYHQKRIPYGEGLVGTCAIEKESTYLTEIPNDYIEITSGLGDSNPTSILLVPLKLEEKIFGVTELASFHELEKFQIDFVEKVAESIASTLSSVKSNMQTNELLEKFQQQSEELAAQEEEMRQNLEELQATQEEAARKGAEMESLINGLNTAAYVIEYDLNGKITHANDKFLNKVHLRRDDVVGGHHTDHLQFKGSQEEYMAFWKELREGHIKKQTSHIKVENRDFIFAETYTPLYDDNGDVFKIMKIAYEMSDFNLKVTDEDN